MDLDQKRLTLRTLQVQRSSISFCISSYVWSFFHLLCSVWTRQVTVIPAVLLAAQSPSRFTFYDFTPWKLQRNTAAPPNIVQAPFPLKFSMLFSSGCHLTPPSHCQWLWRPQWWGVFGASTPSGGLDGGSLKENEDQRRFNWAVNWSRMDVNTGNQFHHGCVPSTWLSSGEAAKTGRRS